jgi:hypothetical protein
MLARTIDAEASCSRTGLRIFVAMGKGGGKKKNEAQAVPDGGRDG